MATVAQLHIVLEGVTSAVTLAMSPVQLLPYWSRVWMANSAGFGTQKSTKLVRLPPKAEEYVGVGGPLVETERQRERERDQSVSKSS